MTKRTDKKRTVSCGKCGEPGHNARSCASAPGGASAEAMTAIAAHPDASQLSTESSDTSPAPSVELRPKSQVTAPNKRRAAPTADLGTAATAAPYRCTKCNQVAILAIVRVKDYAASQRERREVYTGEVRCELCLNKPAPAELILKWGVKPGETVSTEDANAHRM